MESKCEDTKDAGEMVRSLVVLLVLAGVGIGVLLSMEIHGRQRRAGLVASNHELQTQLAFIEAQHGEMLNFLGRPQTELVKLTGAREWSGQAMTIAWNPVQRLAVVLIDRLPSPENGEAYHFRAVSAKGEAVRLGELDSKVPAQHVYSVPTEVGDRFRFEVTLDPAGERDGRVVFLPARI